MLGVKKYEESARGQYITQVVKGDDVIWSSDIKSNYIFNWGLDQVAENHVWADMFKYCRVGNTSTGSLNEPSGGIGVGTDATPTLQNQVMVSNNYFTGNVVSPYDFKGCQTSGYETSGLLMRRTYDFPPEDSYKEYTEIGWSPLSVGNLFSRILTKSGESLSPVQVLEGQSLRVIYEVIVYSGPSNEQSTAPITGWDTNGSMGVQLFGLSAVNEIGNTVFWDEASGANEPSINGKGWISSNSEALSTIGTCVDRSVGTYFESPLTSYSYTNGTFSKGKKFLVPADSGVFSGYRSVGFGLNNGTLGDAAKYNAFTNLFESPVNKELEYIALVVFEYNWGRAQNI